MRRAIKKGRKNNRNIRSVGSTSSNRWSGRVTKKSNALDLEPGVFTLKDPKKIAQSLKRSSEASTHRKGTAFQSAMSMLNLYINRAGKNLSDKDKQPLEKAKDELRKLYGRKKLYCKLP